MPLFNAASRSFGASDAATEGAWKWVAGPENGTTFYVKGAGSQPGFSAWDPADNEPNDTGGAEDVGTFGWAAGGLWNDLPGNAGEFGVVGYLVEFSGTPSPVPVPVPATLVLFGSALAALGVLRRRS